MKELLSSDAVVFATPVYYFTMSAQLKTVIDRFYARNGAITRKHMKAVLISTNFDIIFDYLNFIDCGRVLAKGSGTVSMMPDLYRRQAYELGAKIGG